MVGLTRNRLGLGLQDQVLGIMPGDQPMLPPLPRVPSMGTPAMPPTAPTEPRKQGGFFREGGLGRQLAGAIGDALLQQGGMAPVFTPMQQQRRAMEQQEAQWTRRRQAENEDWMKREQWQRDNPAPRNPHYFETNNGSVGVIGPDGRPQIVYEDPTPKMNFIPDGLGGGQWVAVPTGIPSAPPAATAPRPVGRLGPVVNTLPGGPTQPASGGFPRSGR